MKKQWRVLPAMLALLLCLGPLSGCRNNGEEPAGSLPPSTDVGTPADTGGGNDTPGPAGDRVLAENRQVNYGIVYAEECSATIKESVTYLYDAIKKRSDGGVTTVESAEYGEANDPAQLQILIGDMGTPESNAVLADEFLARAYNKQESFRFGVMSTSSIQQARYATVASVTLFCRTAIDNGLPENLAYSISDSYLLHLDETESIEEIQFLSLSAFREYCQVMQDWRLQSCRKEIKQCCEYILLHIHEPISLTELAELVNFSPNHLSALFLKETSFRPTEYIRAQKLNYARYILDNYSPTIATLANLLAFPSPSAFARQFKQQYGLTPTEYQRRKE